MPDSGTLFSFAIFICEGCSILPRRPFPNPVQQPPAIGQPNHYQNFIRARAIA
jgi:hypothetical protein